MKKLLIILTILAGLTISKADTTNTIYTGYGPTNITCQASNGTVNVVFGQENNIKVLPAPTNSVTYISGENSYPSFRFSTYTNVEPLFTVNSSNLFTSILIPSDLQVEAWAKAGVLCNVIKHRWESGCGMTGCLVIHYDEQRHCSICGKVETRSLEWK